MPTTAWKVRGKSLGGSGPTWDAMSSTDYEDLIDHKWEWTSEWEVFAKSTSDIGVVWSGVAYTWSADPTILASSPWTIMNVTKIQQSTEI